jgi:hypothetical protein
MVETIAELASLSNTLNEKSDKLNATISSINHKLEGLNFGVSVTLAEPIQYGEQTYFLGYEKHQVFHTRKDAKLGEVRTSTGKVRWQLSIYREQSGHHIPLLDAPREVRIQALDHVPALLDLMKEKAEQLIGSMQRAEKLAESL